MFTRLDRRKHGRHACKFLIEIARIGRTADLRDERCRDALMVHIVPVDVAEKGLGHDFLGVGWAGPETYLGLAGEQFLEYGDRVARHMDWVEGLVGKDGVVDILFVFAAEWGLLEEHLIYQNTKGPPIYGTAVLFVEQNLESLVSTAPRKGRL